PILCNVSRTRSRNAVSLCARDAPSRGTALPPSLTSSSCAFLRTGSSSLRRAAIFSWMSSFWATSVVVSTAAHSDAWTSNRSRGTRAEQLLHREDVAAISEREHSDQCAFLNQARSR